MGESGSNELAFPEPPRDRPRVVEEAYEVLTAYGWQLFGTGAAGVGVWLASVWLDATLPWGWLLAFLAALVLLYVAPVTREPRLARDVIRRWDELRVQRALESSGVSDDPRLDVAESMAHRIVRHPAVDARVRRTTEALVERLHLLLEDLRRVQWLGRTNALDESRMARPISDLQDVLDARVASILAQLAELHRTVVLRDAEATARAIEAGEDLLRELEAEQEVERLLADAERSR